MVFLRVFRSGLLGRRPGATFPRPILTNFTVVQAATLRRGAATMEPNNVLVYSGTGASSLSVRQVLFTLRRLLAPHYSVTPITANTILKEPWQTSCALLVIPGGANALYCLALNGDANGKIQQYVRRGGAFWGICAGAYYSSARCELEMHDPKRAQVGDRELKFFPGICRGTAFPGYFPGTQSGAKAAKIRVETEAFEKPETGAELPREFISYYAGGGVFVDADELGKYGDGNKVTVLARYLGPLKVAGGDAAAVHMGVAEGNVVLTSPHIEFAGCNLDRNTRVAGYGAVVDAVIADHDMQARFVKACLVKLGLKVTQEPYVVPPLTPLHLTSVHPGGVGQLVKNLAPLITKEGDKELIVGENEAFCLVTPNSSTFSLGNPPSSSLSSEICGGSDGQRGVKTIYSYPSMLPPKHLTPYFDHTLYYTSLDAYRSKSRLSPSQFGSSLLYGEVVASTSTMFDKNHHLLEKLPIGLTSTCTMQVAGRGRGSNAWVTPIGCLSFSTTLKHPMELNVQSPVVFIQYLAAMAVVEGIKTYAPGYEDIPVRLKWPNDIYAEDPSPTADHDPKNVPKYVKIGGIQVTSNFSANAFHLVISCGINTTNIQPTTSLNLLVSRLNSQRRLNNPSAQPLPSYQFERLLSLILVLFEEHYYHFSLLGFQPFEETYYKHWMHTDQLVRLGMEGGTQARVKGITMDDGLLRVEEVTGDGNNEKKTGRVFTLQSDGNSFDFSKGLLKVKI